MNKYSIFTEKMGFILFQVSFIILVSLFLLLLGIDIVIIILFIIILSLFLISYLLIDYYLVKKKTKEIMELVDLLDEKYLIAEIILKPNKLENYAYYYALKKACKAMNDKISENIQERSEYQEYIESFVHEIKTPISALSLLFDNNNNKEAKLQVQKINDLIEQALFYARSSNLEKDYFIKELLLGDLVHQVILDYKDIILKKKIKINAHDLEKIIFIDEKWLIFILKQIIQNAVKYLDKDSKEIEIYAKENKQQIILSIIDNGCGIKEHEISRVFEKGFTGSNRKKANATGMGLYLAKKLCKRLGIKIEIFSIENSYTKVEITFLKGNMYKFKE